MRKPLSAIGLAVFMLSGCEPQQPAAAPLAAPPPAESAPVASAPPAQAEPPKEAPKPAELTPEQAAKFYQECWAAFNSKDLAKYGACYSENATDEMVDAGMQPLVGKDIVEKGAKVTLAAFPDVTGESQLTLVSGNRVAGVWLIKGTHQGPMPGPNGDVAPTNKKIGYQMANVVELSGGKITRQFDYADQRTFLSQLGLIPGPARKVVDHGAAEKPVVIATGSDAEKANLELYRKYTEAFNKHDAAAAEAFLTDDFVFSDQAGNADLVGKKEASRGMKEMWKGMSDLRMESREAFPAGDYVVSMSTFSGTNDGPLPAMKIWKKTGKKASVNCLEIVKVQGGKLKQHWVFSNGMAFGTQLGLGAPPIKENKPAPAAAAPAKPGQTAAPMAAAAPGTHNTATSPGAKPAASPAGAAPAAAPAAAAPGNKPAPKAAAPAAAAPAAPKPATPATPPASPKNPAPATPPAAPPAAR